MIFLYIFPVILLAPLLYLVIFKINSIYISIFLGNILWILLVMSFYIFDQRFEEPVFFVKLISPIIAVSVSLSLKRILINKKA